jgi:hypothetical protein
MKVMRRRWRLFLGILIVLVAIVGLVFSPSAGVSAGVTLIAFFAVLILIISGNRGNGGLEPQHYQSGNTGNRSYL